MIGQCEVCGQWHTGEHPNTSMTPTTTEREARELLAAELGRSDDMAADWARKPEFDSYAITQGAAIRAIITALTRREAQQEAQGAVCSPGEPAPPPSTPAQHYLAKHNGCASQDWQDGFNVCARTTPPAPVDVRVPMGRFVELLAQLVNAPQTDDEFDADVLRREVVMEKVTQLRVVWDDLSKAHRALLDGQPAGVDDAMVRRAVHAYDEWMIEHAPDETDAYHDGMRAALQAALGGGGGR